MLKDVMNHVNDFGIGSILTVVFFIAFVAIVLHTLLRSRRDVNDAARLPLDDDRTP